MCPDADKFRSNAVIERADKKLRYRVGAAAPKVIVGRQRGKANYPEMLGFNSVSERGEISSRAV